MVTTVFSVPQRKLMFDPIGDVLVIDDRATYGKQNFWMRMKKAIDYCLASNSDYFAILPDDIKDVKWGKIQKIFDHFENQPFIVNVINDHREPCWGSVRKPELDKRFWGIQLRHIDYCDCGFITNRACLEKITVERVPKRWFNTPAKSSGVGRQLTLKMRKQGIPMYVTEPSLCFHGDHLSIMHPQERKKNPLISK